MADAHRIREQKKLLLEQRQAEEREEKQLRLQARTLKVEYLQKKIGALESKESVAPSTAAVPTPPKV